MAHLHYAILALHFDLPAAPSAEHPRLAYSKDVETMFWGVEAGRFDAGFFLPPTDTAVVREVALAGDQMPPKSTYFHPKVDSGLLFYPYEHDTVSRSPASS